MRWLKEPLIQFLLIGDNELSATWTDPDFDPSQHAVYYVREIEIPTPRWSTYNAKLAKKAVSYPGLRGYLPE
jgi:hypothetical protein